ncbi:MAG TPA: hypothetical protein VNW96_20745 [Mycobacterium sp.]|nr:hypothetical protein [Mycobacterium sp.]
MTNEWAELTGGHGRLRRGLGWSTVCIPHRHAAFDQLPVNCGVVDAEVRADLG